MFGNPVGFPKTVGARNVGKHGRIPKDKDDQTVFGNPVRFPKTVGSRIFVKPTRMSKDKQDQTVLGNPVGFPKSLQGAGRPVKQLLARPQRNRKPFRA